MLQGIHLGTQSMTMLMQKQDQIANNLANINTTGFKESNLFAQAYQKFIFDDQLQPAVQSQVKADQVYTNYSEGTMKKTGAPLDLLIKGSGFFTVMTSEGVRYTRNGSFSLNPDGFVVTPDGSKVMSTEGFLRVDTEQPLAINERGEVIQDNEIKGVIRISDFEKPYRLLRAGNNFFKPQLPDNPAIPSQGYVVQQGFLEGSNVNIIQNMANMIGAYREYEANQRAIMAQDETLQRSVRDVGRVGQ